METWSQLATDALERVAGTMEDARFWTLVAGIGWPAAETEALLALSVLDRLAFVARYYERKGALERRLEEWEKAGNQNRGRR